MQITIEKLIYGGDGLAHLPPDEQGRGKAVFVPFVLPGERVEADTVEEKPAFLRARAQQVLDPSPQRVPPGCPYFFNCGGCQYQHAAYEHQLEVKSAILKETLRRLGKLELPGNLHAHASPPWNYRNRTRLRIITQPQFALGYYRFGSHTLLPVEQCPISSPLLNRAMAALWKLGGAGEVPAEIHELELFANAEDDQLRVELLGDRAAKAEFCRTFAARLRYSLAETASVTLLREGTERWELLHGSGELIYRTSRASYRVSPSSFFQTNRFLVDDLVSIVTSGRSGHAALDLYAGVGLFSLPLAQAFERVIAVETSPYSAADLRANSPINVKPVAAATEDYLERMPRKLLPDLVIVDPPRGGLGRRVTSALTRLASPRIVYVSCDPATLARDLSTLLAAGYRVEQAHLVDLFPQTFHIESVLHLVR